MGKAASCSRRRVRVAVTMTAINPAVAVITVANMIASPIEISGA
jgi:hypothetical protein